MYHGRGIVAVLYRKSLCLDFFLIAIAHGEYRGLKYISLTMENRGVSLRTETKCMPEAPLRLRPAVICCRIIIAGEFQNAIDGRIIRIYEIKPVYICYRIAAFYI